MTDFHQVTIYDRRTAQSLVQVIQPFLEQAVKEGNEDATPLFSLYTELVYQGVAWTDESSEMYVWATIDRFPVGGNILPDYKRFEEMTISPIFLSQGAAETWAETLNPTTLIWLWAHLGRGWIGPVSAWAYGALSPCTTESQ